VSVSEVVRSIRASDFVVW